MRTLQVTPRTKRGKQLIKAHGDVWHVVRTRDSVACFDGRPGMFVVSAQDPHSHTIRWIETNGAPHFHIEAEEG